MVRIHHNVLDGGDLIKRIDGGPGLAAADGFEKPAGGGVPLCK